LVLGKLSELIGNILANGRMERLHHELASHIVGQLIRRSKVHSAKVLPFKDSRKGDKMAFGQKVEGTATVGCGFKVEVLVHLDGGKHVVVNQPIHDVIQGEAMGSVIVGNFGGVFTGIDDAGSSDVTKGVL